MNPIQMIYEIPGILILLGFIVYVTIIFNGLISAKNEVSRAWANIDVLLKQRFDEIPNLVKVVEGYSQFEKETLNRLTQARTQFLNSNRIHEKIVANFNCLQGLNRVFAVAENYPQLKASQNFLSLQKRISELENIIADRREFYNSSVTIFNTRIHQFPDLLLARIIHYQNLPLLEGKSLS
jgi:LemA protein